MFIKRIPKTVTQTTAYVMSTVILVPTSPSINLHAFRKPAKDKAVMPKYARLSTPAFLA